MGGSRQPSSSMSDRQWEKSGGFSLTSLILFENMKFSIIKRMLNRLLWEVWNVQLCYTGIKILKNLAVFGLSPVILETRSSEERTEPTYDALYWSWHWRTPKPERVMGRVAWVQDSYGRTVPRIFSSFSRCWASNSFRDLITGCVGVWQRKEYTILGDPIQWRTIPRAHWGSSRKSNFSKSTPIFPILSLSFMQTNSGVPNAAPRTSRPEISFRFILVSSLSKSTVDHSSHLSTLMWRPRSGPSWHKRSQDLMRSSSEPTKTPSSRYQECCWSSGAVSWTFSIMGQSVREKSKGPNGSPCWIPLSLLTTNLS